MNSAKFHIILIKSYSCYTCVIEMLYPSVGVLSFRLEMSENSIDWFVESQLKSSQSYFMLFQLKFSNKKNQDQVDSFKE